MSLVACTSDGAPSSRMRTSTARDTISSASWNPFSWDFMGGLPMRPGRGGARRPRPARSASAGLLLGGALGFRRLGGFGAGAGLAPLHLLLERGLARHGHVGLQELEGLLADPLHQHQVLRLLERTVLLAVVDDPLGHAGAHPRQQGELRGVGAVDVDHPPALRAQGGQGGEEEGEGQQAGNHAMGAMSTMTTKSVLHEGSPFSFSLAKRSVCDGFSKSLSVWFSRSASLSATSSRVDATAWIKPPARGPNGTQVTEEKGVTGISRRSGRAAGGKGSSGWSQQRGGNRGRTGVCRHRKGFGGARDLLRRGSLSSTVAAPWRKNGRSVA